MADKEMTTYLIEEVSGKKKKVTVPSDWKVTFGPAVVGRPNNVKPGYQGKMPMALRFYEHKDRQRAIFTNVANFRDMSIPIQEEIIEERVQNGVVDVQGAKKNVAMKATVKDWVNPDNVDNSNAFKLLENFTTDKGEI